MLARTLNQKPHIGANFLPPPKSARDRAVERWFLKKKPQLTTTTVSDKTLPGQYYDSETNLHYNWNRYYDPELGRYITSDPIGLVAGLNTYNYANSNSPTFYDPYGLWSFGDPLPQGVVDSAAGFGDGVSTVLTLGFYNTADLRSDLGIDGGVNECSESYNLSKYAGYAVGAGTAIAAGAGAWSAGLNGGANSVFWTGHGAEAIAAPLGTTVGKTTIGKIAAKLGIENRWVWAKLSKQFAKNATGRAKLVERYNSPRSIWNTVEKGILKKRGVPVDKF